MTSGVKNVFNSAAYLPAKAALHNTAAWVTLALAVILGLAYVYRRYNTSVAPVPPPKDLDIPKKTQAPVPPPKDLDIPKKTQAPVPPPKDLDIPKKTQPAYYQAPNEGENRWATLPQPIIQVIFAPVEKNIRITSRRVCKTWNIALTARCAILPDLIDVRTIPVLREISNFNFAKNAYRNLKKLVAHVGGWDNYNNLCVFDVSCPTWPKTNGHYKTVRNQIAPITPLGGSLYKTVHSQIAPITPLGGSLYKTVHSQIAPITPLGGSPLFVKKTHRVYVKPTFKTLADLSASDLPAEIVRGITEGGVPYIIYRDGASIGQPKGIFVLYGTENSVKVN